MTEVFDRLVGLLGKDIVGASGFDEFIKAMGEIPQMDQLSGNHRIYDFKTIGLQVKTTFGRMVGASFYVHPCWQGERIDGFRGRYTGELLNQVNGNDRLADVRTKMASEPILITKLSSGNQVWYRCDGDDDHPGCKILFSFGVSDGSMVAASLLWQPTQLDLAQWKAHVNQCLS